MISNKEIIIASNKTLLTQPFGFAATGSHVVSGAGASGKIHVIGVYVHNNNGTGTNDERLIFQDGSNGPTLYGSNPIGGYITGRGGFFELPTTLATIIRPYMITSAGSNLFLATGSSRTIGGIIQYYIE